MREQLPDGRGGKGGQDVKGPRPLGGFPAGRLAGIGVGAEDPLGSGQRADDGDAADRQEGPQLWGELPEVAALDLDHPVFPEDVGHIAPKRDLVVLGVRLIGVF